jgi:DNA-binding NarL/FixJ family response regulator
MAIRLVLADNTSIHCQLLADAVSRDHRIEVVGSVSTERELLELTSKVVFDVTLIALQLDDIGSGRFDVVRELRYRSPDVRNIVLLDTSRREVVIDALRAGTRGIFPRNGTLKMLCKCVRRVYEGQIWAASGELTSTLDAIATASEIRAVDTKKQDLLSKRERQVVNAVAEGLTNREIGERLGLSRHTIKNYLLHVFDKLGVSNRVELLFLSLRQAQNAGNGAQSGSNEIPLSPLQDFLHEASRGSPEALLNTASCFREGMFVPRSLVSAYVWCLMAERFSQLLASQSTAKKQQLIKLMTDDEIAEGTAEAQFWRNRLEAAENAVVLKTRTSSEGHSALEASA